MSLDQAIAAAVGRTHATRTPEDVETEVLTLAWERAKDRNAEARFAEALADAELARVRRAFVREAVHELGDRYGMLVSAGAEGSLGTRPAADVATVARVLRDLDAADCRELRKIAETTADAHMLYAFQRYADAVVYANGCARFAAWEASPSRELLEAMAMVRVDRAVRAPEGLPLLVCTRGALVTSMLEGWR